MSRLLPRPRAVLFDWDNTLVDNWPSICDALNAALTAFGHDPWTVEETRRRVRHSMRDSFPKLFGERWPEARTLFYETFAAGHLDTLTPLPGVQDLLESLYADGLYLGVVSNKRGEFLRKEADHLGWTGVFGRLVGAGDAARDKPAPEPVLLALDGSGHAPGATVWLVGDAAVDMECALRSGCTPILYRAGDEDESAFADWPPDGTISSPQELITLVRTAPQTI